MATYIKNTNDLQALLKKKMYLWMCDIQKKLPEYLEEFIYSEYYKQYTPSEYYDRQYRILNAIMTSEIKDLGTGYSFELYLDPDKVSYDPSLWITHGVSYYRKGDDANTVFRNMAKGIHGSTDFGVTPGRFWEKFLQEIGEGGIYDIFINFKKYLGTRCGLTIK